MSGLVFDSYTLFPSLIYREKENEMNGKEKKIKTFHAPHFKWMDLEENEKKKVEE